MIGQEFLDLAKKVYPPGTIIFPSISPNSHRTEITTIPNLPEYDYSFLMDEEVDDLSIWIKNMPSFICYEGNWALIANEITEVW